MHLTSGLACAFRIFELCPTSEAVHWASTKLCKRQNTLPSGLVANFRVILEDKCPKIGHSNSRASCGPLLGQCSLAVVVLAARTLQGAKSEVFVSGGVCCCSTLAPNMGSSGPRKGGCKTQRGAACSISPRPPAPYMREDYHVVSPHPWVWEPGAKPASPGSFRAHKRVILDFHSVDLFALRQRWRVLIPGALLCIFENKVWNLSIFRFSKNHLWKVTTLNQCL